MLLVKIGEWLIDLCCETSLRLVGSPRRKILMVRIYLNMSGYGLPQGTAVYKVRKTVLSTSMEMINDLRLTADWAKKK